MDSPSPDKLRNADHKRPTRQSAPANRDRHALHLRAPDDDARCSNRIRNAIELTSGTNWFGAAHPAPSEALDHERHRGGDRERAQDRRAATACRRG